MPRITGNQPTRQDTSGDIELDNLTAQGRRRSGRSSGTSQPPVPGPNSSQGDSSTRLRELAVDFQEVGSSGSTEDKPAAFNRLTEFQSRRYDAGNSPSSFGMQDPLLRNYQVGQFGKTTANLPPFEQQRAREARSAYTAGAQAHAQESGSSFPMDRAVQLSQQRADARQATREATTDPEPRRTLENAEMRGFGQPQGETFEQNLTRRVLSQGVEGGVRSLTGATARTNQAVNRGAGVAGATPQRSSTQEDFRRSQLRELESQYPEYTPQSGLSIEQRRRTGQQVSNLTTTHYPTPASRRNPQTTPEQQADIGSRMQNMQQDLDRSKRRR